MIVKVLGYSNNDYHKELATLSERQVHYFVPPIRSQNGSEFDTMCDGISVVIDPKDFPEMDRFVICIQKSDK